MLYSEKKYLDYEGLKYYHTKMMQKIGLTTEQIEINISTLNTELREKIDGDVSTLREELESLISTTQQELETSISDTGTTLNNRIDQIINNTINGLYFEE